MSDWWLTQEPTSPDWWLTKAPTSPDWWVDGSVGGPVADPYFTSQPVDAVVAIGEDASFSETHVGTGTIGGVWQELKV
jgi:hypothetical protein